MNFPTAHPHYFNFNQLFYQMKPIAILKSSAFAILLILSFCMIGCKKDAQKAVNTPTTAVQLQPMPPFDYVAPEPVNGILKGVIEMGATGFNAFIVRIDAAKNWKLAQKPEYGSSLVNEHMATEADIKASLTNYIEKIANSGVTGDNIHFVVSSGAKDEENVQKIIKSLKALGYFVNTVTAEEEGKHSLTATLPKQFQDKAFMLDLGSANTQLAYTKDNKITSFESFGSKYFQKGTADTAVYSEVRKVANNIPSDKTEICFVIGGVPFELAKQTRVAKEPYTVLHLPVDYQASGDKQRAGINIYKAVADATGCKKFVFAWDANFAIGFLQNLKKKPKPKPAKEKKIVLNQG
jgi:hypothetical protein